MCGIARPRGVAKQQSHDGCFAFATQCRFILLPSRIMAMPQQQQQQKRLPYYAMDAETRAKMMAMPMCTDRPSDVGNHSDQDPLQCLLSPWIALTRMFDPMWVQMESDRDACKQRIYAWIAHRLVNVHVAHQDIEPMPMGPGCFEVSAMTLTQHQFFDPSESDQSHAMTPKLLWYFLTQEIWHSAPMTDVYKNYWIDWVWSRLDQRVVWALNQLATILQDGSNPKVFAPVRHKSHLYAIPYPIQWMHAWLPSSVRDHVDDQLNCHYAGSSVAFWDALRFDQRASTTSEPIVLRMSRSMMNTMARVFGAYVHHERRVLSSLVHLIEPYRSKVMRLELMVEHDMAKRLTRIHHSAHQVVDMTTRCFATLYAARAWYRLAYDDHGGRKRSKSRMSHASAKEDCGKTLAQPILAHLTCEDIRVKFSHALNLELQDGQMSDRYVQHRIVQCLTAPLLIDVFNIDENDHLTFAIWLYQQLDSEMADLIDTMAEMIEQAQSTV